MALTAIERATRHLAHNRAWNAAHPKNRKASDRKYRAAHHEAINARQRARYAADPTHWKWYYEAHREECKARVRAWQAAHPERIAAYKAAARAFDLAHPEIARACREAFSARRRELYAARREAGR